MRFRRRSGESLEARRRAAARVEQDRKIERMEWLTKRLAWLRARERPCDGDIDEVICFWERLPGPLNKARENLKAALEEAVNKDMEKESA
jgi:hypothetical protein